MKQTTEPKLFKKISKYFTGASESGVVYVIYKRPENWTDAQLYDWLNDNFSLGGYYGGIGRYFEATAIISYRKKYVVMSSHWGYDI